MHKWPEGRSSPSGGQNLSCDLRDGSAEGGEPIEDGDTDLELCNLTVEVPRGQAALPEEPDAVHLGFSAASAVVVCGEWDVWQR